MSRRSEHLSNEELGVILAEHNRGSSQQAIGMILDRLASTVCRELARGRQDEGTSCTQSGAARLRRSPDAMSARQQAGRGRCDSSLRAQPSFSSALVSRADFAHNGTYASR
jgi:IS30 family transposase